MRNRIDFDKISGDPLHGLRICLYVALLFAMSVPLMEGVNRLFGATKVIHDVVFIGSPVIIAGGVTVGEGVDRFKGRPVPTGWREEFTIILSSIVFTTVVAPSLFTWGLQERASWRNNPGNRARLILIILALTIGGTLLVSSTFVGPLAYLSFQNYRRMVADNRINANREALTNTLVMMSWRAQNFYFLQQEKGGGGSSWMTRDDVRKPLIALADVRLPVARMVRDVDPLQQGSFVLEVVGPDSLLLWGVGSEARGLNDTTLNKDGQHGRVQVQIGVSPLKFCVLGTE